MKSGLMSTRPPRLPSGPPSREEAKVCLWSNLAVPGLGSWRAGWRISGALQIALAAVGLALGFAWFAWFLLEWAQTGRLPVLVALESEGRMPDSWLNYLLLGLGSVVTFGTSLVWAFVTSLCVRSQAVEDPHR